MTMHSSSRDNDSNIVVSICCITYNHEKYIRDCLDGFLMQKTDFPFEILIFDDASTDNTQSIIKEYAEKNSNIITFLQTENQWVNRRYGFFDWLLPNAKGKYIALCEGDDYWLDQYKLQKQFDLLNLNPNTGLNYTSVQKYIEIESRYTNTIQQLIPNFYSVSEYVGAGSPFINTCTWMIRKEALINYIPRGFGDLDLVLSILSRGYHVIYSDYCSAVYRILPQSASHFSDDTGALEVHFFHRKMKTELAYVTNAGERKKIERRFYSKYFHLLKHLNLSLRLRVRIALLVFNQKSKINLIKQIIGA
jgi:glycosyltransferase involved in cell wall biosynthesis